MSRHHPHRDDGISDVGERVADHEREERIQKTEDGELSIFVELECLADATVRDVEALLYDAEGDGSGISYGISFVSCGTEEMPTLRE